MLKIIQPVMIVRLKASQSLRGVIMFPLMRAKSYLNIMPVLHMCCS